MAFPVGIKKMKPPAPVSAGESLVSTVGYVNNQRRVENMIRSGMRLRQFRADPAYNPDDVPDSPQRYMDKIDSINAMRAQLDATLDKLQKQQEDAVVAQQKALEEHKAKEAVEDAKLRERMESFLAREALKDVAPAK